jgi:hypothetical protein
MLPRLPLSIIGLVPPPESRKVWAALALWMGVAALCALRQSPPAALPADAPPEKFSAGRARAVLRDLVGDGVPHPTGSLAQSAAANRILDRLQRLGYAPRVQEVFACGRYGTCGTVRNILARREGTTNGRAVLLAAHYDSVGAGPGASDNGIGVASLLEIARILQLDRPRRNPVVLLFDDGEEQGLLGAEAFASRDPWGRQVGAAVNLDGRGTCGASRMFETSDGDLWLVRLLGQSLRRPNTSSLFPAIYRLLPNDTDLTAFREHGIPGVNFAYIGGAARYHTPRDDLAHSSPATLQHQGQSALAIVRVLADVDLAEAHSPRNATFFDVAGFGILWWPSAWMPVLALAALALAGVAAGVLLRKGDLDSRSLAAGSAAALGAGAASVAAAAALREALRWAGAIPAAWTARPAPAVLGLAAAAAGAALAVCAWAARRAGFAGLWFGIWILWSLAGLFLALRLPGASHVIVLPAAAASLSAVPWIVSEKWSPSRDRWAAILPPAAAAFFLVPIALSLYDALGFGGAAGIGLVVGLLALSLAPLAAAAPGRWLRAALALLAAAAILTVPAALSVRRFTPDSPERLTLLWQRDAAAGRNRWLAEGPVLPPGLARAAGFGSLREPAWPWSRPDAFAAAAAPGELPEPRLELESSSAEGGLRTVRGRLVSARGARTVGLAFPPSASIASLRMEGQPAALRARAVRRAGGWKIYRCVTLPPEGVPVEISFPGGKALHAVVFDESPGLPPAGAALAAARPADAVPTDEGDRTIVLRRIEIGAAAD